MRQYTKSHEWIDSQGEVATVGITEQALKEIGEVVYIELPKVGRQVTVGQEVVVLESTKAAIDICSPVEGKIIKVNSAIRDNIQLINQSPEKEGWLYQVELSTK
jgi:glycine cleavage system H protein